MKAFANRLSLAAFLTTLAAFSSGMATAVHAQDATPATSPASATDPAAPAIASSEPAITKNAGLTLPSGAQLSEVSNKTAVPVLQQIAGTAKDAPPVENVEVWRWVGADFHAGTAGLKTAVESKFKAAGYVYQAGKPQLSKSGKTTFTFFRAQNASSHKTLVGFWLDNDSSVGFALGYVPASDTAPTATTAAAPATDPNDPLAPLTSAVTGVKMPRGAVRSADTKILAAITAQLQGLSESGGLKGTCETAESLEWKGATLTDANQQVKEAEIIKSLQDGGWSYQKVGGDTRGAGVTRTFFLAHNGDKQVIGILRHAKQSLTLDWSVFNPAP